MKRIAPVLAVVAVLALAGCSGGPGGSPARPGGQPKPGGTATGCGIVTASQVSKIAGVTFSSGVSSPPKAVTPTKQIPVTSNQSCSYKLGDSTYVEYFINSLSVPAAAYETNVWKDDKIEEPSSVDMTVDGFPALGMVEEGAGGRTEQVIFYKGQTVVQINTDGVAEGTAIDVANLVGKRI